MYRGAGLVSVPRYTAVLFSYTKPRLTIYGTVTDFSDLLVLEVESSNIYSTVIISGLLTKWDNQMM